MRYHIKELGPMGPASDRFLISTPRLILARLLKKQYAEGNAVIGIFDTKKDRWV